MQGNSTGVTYLIVRSIRSSMQYLDVLYKQKIVRILRKHLSKRKKILDVGCGDCSDAMNLKKYGMHVYGIDIFKHKNVSSVFPQTFKLGTIYKIPFNDNYFDYVFSHDVLHHIDEKEQFFSNHVAGLTEMKRVCKKNGKIIILEANRYNPLFYPHMVVMKSHNHFTQPYFINVCKQVFSNPEFHFFEAHVYPKILYWFFKPYEKIMEIMPFLRPFRAYNMMVYKNI